MDTIQKKILWSSIAIFLLTIGCALLIRTGGDLFLQPAFSHLFARYDLSSAILSITILIIGFFLSQKMPAAMMDKCLDFIGDNLLKISFFFFIAMAVGAYFVYHHHPLCMDEYMPYFQARTFAEGKLWGQYPPQLVPWLLRPGFFSVFSTETGRVVSDYWPGFALLLTPFVKLGVPWLLNPIISAGTLFVGFYYTKKIFQDSSAASWCVLLTLSSTVFIINGISFYSMSAHLLLNLLYSTLLLNISPLKLFLAGVVGSFALVLHNPMPHFLFAIPWLIWIALKPNRSKNLGMLFLGYLPLSLLLGFGWVQLKIFIQTKSNLQPLIPNDTIGASFAERISAILKSSLNLPSFEILWFRLLGLLKIFAWSLPGLPILAVFGIKYIRGNTHLKLWGWSALSTLAGYMFVRFSQGHGWGFRYFHSAWFALPLLSTACLASFPISQTSWKKIIFTLTLLSLLFSTTLRFYQVHQFTGQHISQLPQLPDEGRYICFLDSSYGYYVNDLVQNDPFLRDPVIYMWKTDIQKDREMMQNFFPEARQISVTKGYILWRLPE